MDELDFHIHEATRKIAGKYFLLPIHESPGKFIERVYCYELYHQLRVELTDQCAYTLNAEVDKGNHPYFKEVGLDAIPDFLIHVPGQGNFYNHTVIEVKKPFDRFPLVAASRELIRADVEKLIRFQREAHYRRAIFLVYGQYHEHEIEVLRAVSEAQQRFDCNYHVEVWFHRAAQEAAFQAAVV